MALSNKNVIVFLATVCILFTLVRVVLSQNLLEVPLFEVGTLWFRATQNLTSQVKDAIFHFPQDIYSVWTYIKLGLLSCFIYGFYTIMIKPLNRVRMLGDVGYICESGLTKKEMANLVRKRRPAGNIPPAYPNGWFSVMESRDLVVGEAKSVSCLGLHLAVFRGEDGRPHITDAFCPHMGANLAVGGQVKGNCLECPFHGWRFSGDTGKCTHIPYAEGKIPDQAKVKSYNCLERNQFIHIWYHAEGKEPYWEPPEIKEITTGQWTYKGRTEHIINAHIEEIPENGADVAHLGQVHSPFMYAGIDLRYIYSKVWSFLQHNWKAAWAPGSTEEDKHIGTMTLSHHLGLFGKEVHILDADVTAQQLGPSIVYLHFNAVFGKCVIMQSVTPMDPLTQRVTHQVYMPWYMPTVVGKFVMLSEALQVERDIMIWNNKKYQNKPVFVKSKEDSLVAKHRRWYAQFYSENSPKITFQKDTLEW